MSFDLDPLAPNIFPAKYRQVAVNEEPVATDPDSLRQHFLGREAYAKTRFIIVRSRSAGSETAVVTEVVTEPGPELFRPIVDLRLLVDETQCLVMSRPDVDVGIASQIAQAIPAGSDHRCVIVEGRYSHISFLLNPEPLVLNVLDIVPPAPSKLLDQLARILDTAEDTPPVVLSGESVDAVELLQASSASSDHVLLPCRGPGVTLEGTAVSYLDQRPPKEDWTLLGCERSEQIHRWFYSADVPSIDTCPRQFLGVERDADGATLTRCCLLQQGLELSGRAVLVPWGSSLAEVGAALDRLIAQEGLVWTPI